jgi:hypothetical protein
MSADEKRAAYIDGMQKLLDLLRADESIPLPQDGSSRGYPLDFGIIRRIASGEQFAAIIRTLAGEEWQQELKSSGEFEWLDIRGRIAGLWVQLAAAARNVCEPFEPQPRPQPRCPELDALLAEPQEGDGS